MRLTLVCGMSLQGKTTFALWKLREQAPAEFPRVLVLDPVNSKPFKGYEFDVEARDWDELARFLARARGRWTAILRAVEFDDYVVTLERARYFRHVTILVDEAMIFTESPESLEPLIKAARTSAHFGDGAGVNVWMTAQRPMDLPRDVRSQLTQAYSFRQDEPGDLDFMAKKFSPDFAEQVAGLSPHKVAAFPPDTKAIEEWNERELEALPGHGVDRARDDVDRQQEPRERLSEADRRLSEGTDHERTSAPSHRP